VSPNLPIRVFPAQAFDQLAVGGFNYSEANEPLHRATLDHSRDMDTTLDRIFAKGFKRPGLLIARKSDAVPRMHASGRFVARLWDRQLLQADSIFRADEIPACRRELAGWLESHRPDVLIVADHPMLSLLDRYFSETDRWIPTACLNAWWDASGTQGIHAGIRQSLTACAAQSVRLVVEQINLGTSGLPENPKTVLLSGRWFDGKSLGTERIELAPKTEAVRAG
jgi:LacI family transcriptional regulator